MGNNPLFIAYVGNNNKNHKGEGCRIKKELVYNSVLWETNGYRSI